MVLKSPRLISSLNNMNGSKKEDKEYVIEMFNHFTSIVNGLKASGKEISQGERIKRSQDQ